MTEASTERPAAPAQIPLAVVGVVALAIALRFVHWSSAVGSPLTYQLGPDEEYYFRFARAVASGGANTPEFTFMDPGYGFLLGMLFKLVQPNVFLVFGLQCTLDVFTAIGLLLIGRELNRARAGLFGAALYGLSSIALMFSCALLKEVWVAAFMTYWVYLSLIAWRGAPQWIWVLIGVLCGVGVTFRSTFLLMGLASIMLAVLHSKADHRARRFANGALVLGALLVTLLPASARNARIDGSLSPLPHNGGIVLHQAYNQDNKDSAIWAPPFVHYLEPSEIWRGYAAEAERRLNHPLSPAAVNSYWQQQALTYMAANPLTVTGQMAKKALKFFASTDIPINRSLREEAMFSPVIKVLPDLTPLLLAMGFAGLWWFARQDGRWPLLAVPLFVTVITFGFFWAEDRFRYHVIPLLSLLSGIGIDASLVAIKSRRGRPVLSFGAGSALLCGASFALGATLEPPPVHWDQIVWGYIKMGRPQLAAAQAERAIREQPQNAGVLEALGYLAVLRRDFPAAVDAYQRAVSVRPTSDQAHLELAKSLVEIGQRDSALREARLALQLKPDPEYQALVRQLESAP